MKVNRKIIFLLILSIIGIILLDYSIPYLIPPPNRFSNFNGNAESFNFTGQNSEVLFSAKTANFKTNDTIFRSIKNITIEDYTGKVRLINQSSFLEVKSSNNPYYQILLFNVNISILFTNLSMNLDNVINLNRIDLSGQVYPSTFEPHGGKSIIQKGGVDSVIIDETTFTDFRQISFEMDNSSSILVFSDTINLFADRASDLKIFSNSLSKLSIFDGEGILNLDDHMFNIRRTDWLDILVLQNYKSSLKVDDTNVIFIGFTNSTKLNNKDIILGDFFYWLKMQPEKISALAVLIALFLTAWSSYSTHRLVSMETEKKKHEEQKFLNILLAEFETNSILLEDLKNAVKDIIKDKSNIHEFQFLGFKRDGFDAFRNQGGFEYIDIELYNKIVGYYNLLYRISKKFDLSTERNIILASIYIRDDEPLKDIEAIEGCNGNLKRELEKEIGKI